MTVEEDIATIRADVSAIREDIVEIKAEIKERLGNYNGRLRNVECEQAAQKTRLGIIGSLSAAIGILVAALAAWLGGSK